MTDRSRILWATGVKAIAYDEPRLQRLVGRIYDAAADVALWPSVLVEIADRLKANSGVLYVVNPGTGGLDFLYSSRVDWETLSLAMREDYRSIDVFNKLYARMPEQITITRNQFIPDREYTANAFYEDILGPCQMWHMLGDIPLRDPSAVAITGFHRSQRQRNFSKEEFDFYRLLSPHIKGSVRLMRHMTALEADRQNVTEAVDRLALGVIFIDAAGRATQMNESARLLTTQDDGLRVDKFGRIHCARNEETAALERLGERLQHIVDLVGRDADAGITH